MSVGWCYTKLTQYYQYSSDSTILHQPISILHHITNITRKLYHLDHVVLVALGNIPRLSKIVLKPAYRHCIKTTLQTVSVGWFLIQYLLNITNTTQYYINQFQYHIILPILQGN